MSPSSASINSTRSAQHDPVAPLQPHSPPYCAAKPHKHNPNNNSDSVDFSAVHSRVRRLNVRASCTSTTVDYLDLDTYSSSTNNTYTTTLSYETETATTANMRFTSSATPTLTPLGVRLMTLSSNKLARLEAPVGTRDPAGALRKEVLVRAAVRSAWASLDDGPSDLTDWRAPTALGLDTLTEEDEDEDTEAAEAAWLDNVLSSFDEHPTTSEAWAETTVLRPEVDDFDYDDDAVLEAFTFEDIPSMSSSVSSSMDIEEADALVANALAADVTVVEVSAVDDEYEYGDYDYEAAPTSWIELDSDYSLKKEVQHVEDVQDDNNFHHKVGPQHDDLPSSTSSCSSLSSPSEDSDTPEETLLSPNLSPETNALLQAIPASKRPALVRAQMYNTYTAFGTDVDEEDCSDDEVSCPDLIEHRHPHCEEDINYESDDDDCPCRTPPLMSCDQLEVTASPKPLTIWSEGVCDWNLFANTH